MTETLQRGVRLHPVEVDLLCTFAEVEPPYPLEIPSSGTTDTERQLLFKAAGAQLAERGLADEDGPLEAAEEFVHMVRTASGAVDLVLATEQIGLRAALLVHGPDGLLVVQDTTESGGGIVRLREYSVDDGVDALVRLVPKVAAASSTPFTLPLATLRRAFDAMLEQTDDGRNGMLGVEEVAELVSAYGLDGKIVRRMINSLQPVTANGQAGCTALGGIDQEWQRVGEEIRWVDTPRGRFLLAGGQPAPRGYDAVQTGPDAREDDWVSVNPFSPEDLRTAFRKLAARVRG